MTLRALTALVPTIVVAGVGGLWAASAQAGNFDPTPASRSFTAVERCDPSTDADGDRLSDCDETLTYHTDPYGPDTDLDGCTDGAEINNTPQFGGQRNPLHFWDYYDVDGMGPGFVRDKVVDLPNDILGVLSRAQARDDLVPGDFDRNSDPLSEPNPPVSPASARQNYHPRFDRGKVSLGGEPWDMTKADGVIDLPNDILGVSLQYQHNCRVAPVNVVTPQPTVDIKANNSGGPIAIDRNTAATLSWSSTDATSCIASGGWFGTQAATGSRSTGALTISTTYTLSCSGLGGSTVDSVTVNVSLPPATSNKTTICHATGSAKNPYNLITVANSALPAHRSHQGRRDIIPAPAAGCPTH